MLVDTSGLICYFDRTDRRHAAAKRLFDGADVRVTHSYVLAEFVAFCQRQGLNRLDTLSFVAGLADDPAIETIWVDEVLHRTALSLLLQRTDKSYSLADAVSFLLMKQRDLWQALTTDHHFEQEGFVKLL